METSHKCTASKSIWLCVHAYGFVKEIYAIIYIVTCPTSSLDFIHFPDRMLMTKAQTTRRKIQCTWKPHAMQAYPICQNKYSIIATYFQYALTIWITDIIQKQECIIISLLVKSYSQSKRRMTCMYTFEMILFESNQIICASMCSCRLTLPYNIPEAAPFLHKS